MNHEVDFVDAFVLRERRARLLELLRNPRRRRDVLAELYHFRQLDPRFTSPIPSSCHTAEAIGTLLVERGAPAACHLISTNEELDGRDLPLVLALGQLVGTGEAALVSCVPGVLGYFEGEDVRYLLARTTGRRRSM